MCSFSLALEEIGFCLGPKNSSVVNSFELYYTRRTCSTMKTVTLRQLVYKAAASNTAKSVNQLCVREEREIG